MQIDYKRQKSDEYPHHKIDPHGDGVFWFKTEQDRDAYMRHSLEPTAEFRFFLIDIANNSLLFFDSVEIRDSFAEKIIESYLDTDNTWVEGVEDIIMGEVTHKIIEIDAVLRPSKDDLDENSLDGDAQYWDSDIEKMCSYKLMPLESFTPLVSTDINDKRVLIALLESKNKEISRLKQIAADTLVAEDCDYTFWNELELIKEINRLKGIIEKTHDRLLRGG